MNTLGLVQLQHLERKAVIYIRQSTEQQIYQHQESRKLQHAMREHAAQLGWTDDQIETVETDTGITGKTTARRDGYKQLMADVALGQVGIVISYESARLSRNCSDWYPLLDVCAASDCLIADRDGVYDPQSANGRLLLGMKGILSEVELHTLRGRLLAGVRNKAARGELAVMLPTGYVRQEDGRIVKDPDLAVAQAIAQVFELFLQHRSCMGVARELRKQGLRLPRRGGSGELVWREPDRRMVTTILHNPLYTGAYVYGRREFVRTRNGKMRGKVKQDKQQWDVLLKNHHPAYISWETFEQIEKVLADNYAEYRQRMTRGVPRKGTSLLQGLVYCRICGHKMKVQYKNGRRYICNYHQQTQPAEPICQNLHMDPIDQAVVGAFFAALAPAELDLYEQARATQEHKATGLKLAQERQLQRLRYEVDLARRQYDRVDPDNRLVASELERRWESALRALRDAEEEMRRAAQMQNNVIPLRLPKMVRDKFSSLSASLPEVWDSSLLSTAQKKALIRCLVDKVVLERAKHRWNVVAARIIWRGGAVTELDVSVPVHSLQQLPNHEQLIERIMTLTAEGLSDAEIAQTVREEGHVDTHNQPLVNGAIKRLRLKSGCRRAADSHATHFPGSLTVREVAQALDVPMGWIHHRIHQGVIKVEKDPETKRFLFPDDSETLTQLRQLRDGHVAQTVVARGYQGD